MPSATFGFPRRGLLCAPISDAPIALLLLCKPPPLRELLSGAIARSFGGEGVSSSDVLIFTAPSAVIDSLTVGATEASFGACRATTFTVALVEPVISVWARFLQLAILSSCLSVGLDAISVLVGCECSVGISKLDRGDASELARSCVLDAEPGVLLSKDEEGFRSSCMLDDGECTLSQVEPSEEKERASCSVPSLCGECCSTSIGTPLRK